MKYSQTIILKNGKEALLRNGDFPDGSAVYEVFNLTHAETDYLLSYSDENSLDPEQEAKFLEEKAKSPNGVEILALVDGKIVGLAGIEPVGAKYKVRHRADFGISVLKDYWGLGLGRALALYRDLGFVEYGRNPRGFNSRLSGYQELVYMLLEL